MSAVGHELPFPALANRVGHSVENCRSRLEVGYTVHHMSLGQPTCFSGATGKGWGAHYVDFECCSRSVLGVIAGHVRVEGH